MRSRWRPSSTATARRSSTRFEAQGVEIADRRRRDRARHPAERGLLQPGPGRPAAARPAAAGHRPGGASTRTTSRSTTSCAACCSRCRSRGNPECLDGPGAARVLRRRRRPGRDRHRARPRPRHADATTSCARRTGCAPKTSFTAITGESHRRVPDRPGADPGNEVNDPDSLDVHRSCPTGPATTIALDSEDAEGAADPRRARTPLAARLRAIYGSVNNVDAFVGMVAEPHLPGRGDRRAAAGHLDAAVPGAARRRPVLLRQRPGPERHPQRLRDRLPAHLAHVIAPNTDIPLADAAPQRVPRVRPRAGHLPGRVHAGQRVARRPAGPGAADQPRHHADQRLDDPVRCTRPARPSTRCGTAASPAAGRR